MAKQEINLTKEIISPKQANKKLNINFQEVAKSILESKIEARQSKLSLINERLFKLLSPSIKEHPIYPDGTILRINAEDTAGTNIQNPYIMQEGTKRYFVRTRIN